jgi:hypothetical protein
MIDPEICPLRIVQAAREPRVKQINPALRFLIISVSG